MIETAEVGSLDEFESHTAGYKHAMFRGQSKEYAAITPSLFRLSKPIDLQPLLKAADNLWLEAHGINEEMRRIRDMDYRHYGSRSEDDADEFEGGLFDFERLKARFDKWICPIELDGYPFNIPVGSGMGTTESYSKVFMKYYGRVPNERLCIALLQHYGVPSGAIDVSSDRRVALWFASHVLNRGPGQASYSPNANPGVVYVMEVPEAHMIDIRGGDKIEFDLSNRIITVPVGGLRGWRQEGALIFGSSLDDPDLMKYVVKKITVVPGTFDPNDDRVRPLTQQRLFPSPDEDDFYQGLLRAKDSDDPATRQLASFIPLYVVAKSPAAAKIAGGEATEIKVRNAIYARQWHLAKPRYAGRNAESRGYSSRHALGRIGKGQGGPSE
jgi:hypothetical protein